MRFRLWLGLSLLQLAACATTPLPLGQDTDAADFTLQGRAAVRGGGKTELLRVDWQHRKGEDHISLSTMLGQTLAEIELRADAVAATLADGRRLEAQDDTALAQQLLGSPLPLRRLAGWVSGQASAQQAAARDEAGNLLRLEDGGWQLSYSGYGEDPRHPDLPMRVDAQQGDIGIRLKIEHWQRGGEDGRGR